MFSFEAVWIIPMTLVLIILGILLIGYGVFLDDFLLNEERHFILNSQSTASINDEESESKAVKEKDLFVFKQLIGKANKTWSQPLLNGSRIYEEMTFKGIEIHRIRMGLMAKYGKDFFEKER